MEDARASTSSQRPESFPVRNNRDIPVLLQELVYGSKEEGVGTSSKSLNRQNELLYSSEEIHGARKDRRTSEGLDTYFLQGKSTRDKSLVENQSMLSEDQKELAQGKENSPVEAPQASTSKGAKQGQ
ncbi:hypothetical protein O181_034795 [Austropuccinia psidii MF-1]|uniref:Uncharacterized protein n=1 Tax=Austropuccinia psidii MF-1 TaxID=1389203 RepID=A0A9Q3D5Q4_9BASI|nr:hypothetical protein [Austropuccinia psidii MF-1]